MDYISSQTTKQTNRERPTNPLSLISYPVLRRNQVMNINIDKFQQKITLKLNHQFSLGTILQSIDYNLKHSLKQRLHSKLKKNQENRQQNSLPFSLSSLFCLLFLSLVFLLCRSLSHYPYFLIFCFVSSDKVVLCIPRLIWNCCFSCFSLLAFLDQQETAVPKKSSLSLKYLKRHTILSMLLT